MEPSTTPESADPAMNVSFAQCQNCDAPVTSQFCPECGQETGPVKTVRELISGQMTLDGKLWQTMRLLILRPGQITVDYIAGRRVRFIKPLQLYMAISLILFALLKFGDISVPRLVFDEHNFSIAYSTAQESPSDKPTTAPVAPKGDVQHWEVKSGDDKPAPRTPAGPSKADQLAKLNPAMGGKLKAFMHLSAGRQTEILVNGFFKNVPYALVCTLPVFAFYLKLLYRRPQRPFGQHLVFSLHVNAFALLVLCLIVLLPGHMIDILLSLLVFTQVWANPPPWLGPGVLAKLAFACQVLGSAWVLLKVLLCAWALAYLPMSVRRVYGGSRMAVAWRSAVLLMAYGAVLVLAALVAEGLAILL